MHLVKKQLLSLCRTLHVYLTMLGLLVMLLFGVTGFTINHEEWFGATHPRIDDREAAVPRELAAGGDALRLVEHLRTTYRISGAMSDYDAADGRISVAFKDPGQLWEADLDQATGHLKLHHETYNLAAYFNNLHRGRYSGPAWSWVIDLTALFIVLACATGIVLWLALPRRRTLGLIAFTVGVLGTAGVIYLLVPGADAAPKPSSAAPRAK